MGLAVGNLVGAEVGDVLEVVERLLGGALLEEDVALEPPGDGSVELVAAELLDGDGEDPVKFLKSALLGLGDEEEDHEEGDSVESSIETEGTLRDELVMKLLLREYR